MRGKGAAPIFGGMTSGITPADAGKRPTTVAIPNLNPDYPRRCGEKTSKVLNRKHLHEVVLKFH